MPMDEPCAGSAAREIFEAHRIIDVHRTRSPDRVLSKGGCLQCRDRHSCAQLDWALERFAHYASIMLQKP